MELPTRDLDILLIVCYYNAWKYITNLSEKQTSKKQKGKFLLLIILLRASFSFYQVVCFFDHFSFFVGLIINLEHVFDVKDFAQTTSLFPV